eukprot:3921299-Amphidinium_carterae.2
MDWEPDPGPEFGYLGHAINQWAPARRQGVCQHTTTEEWSYVKFHNDEQLQQHIYLLASDTSPAEAVAMVEADTTVMGLARSQYQTIPIQGLRFESQEALAAWAERQGRPIPLDQAKFKITGLQRSLSLLEAADFLAQVGPEVEALEYSDDTHTHTIVSLSKVGKHNKCHIQTAARPSTVHIKAVNGKAEQM